MGYYTWSCDYTPITEEVIAQYAKPQMERFIALMDKYELTYNGIAEFLNVGETDTLESDSEILSKTEDDTLVDKVAKDLRENFDMLYVVMMELTKVSLDVFSSATCGDYVGGKEYEGFVVLNRYVLNKAIPKEILDELETLQIVVGD